MKLFHRVFATASLSAFALTLSISAITPQAYAGQSVTQVAKENILKRHLVRSQSERIVRHQGMELAEIKKELRGGLESNQDAFRTKGLLSSDSLEKFQAAQQGIENLTSKEQIIRAEEEAGDRLVSADVYIFHCLRGFYGSRISPEAKFGITLGSLGAVPLVLLAVDFATLPVTIVMSVITGW